LARRKAKPSQDKRPVQGQLKTERRAKASYFPNGIIVVNLHQLWRPTVAAYLSAPGRTFVAGMDVARSVGRSYVTMTGTDWRTLARVVIACGWKSRKVDGVQVWQRVRALSP
jgi:hypothetical protein